MYNVDTLFIYYCIQCIIIVVYVALMQYICVADTPSGRATLSRATLCEGVKVVVDEESVGNVRSLTVMMNGSEQVRMFVEEGGMSTTLIIRQTGMGMIDAQSSLQMLESAKAGSEDNVYGG